MIVFEAEDDFYFMTVNDTPVTFNNGRYLFISSPSSDPINGQTYNVIINNKK